MQRTKLPSKITFTAVAVLLSSDKEALTYMAQQANWDKDQIAKVQEGKWGWFLTKESEQIIQASKYQEIINEHEMILMEDSDKIRELKNQANALKAETTKQQLELTTA